LLKVILSGKYRQTPSNPISHIAKVLLIIVLSAVCFFTNFAGFGKRKTVVLEGKFL